MRLRNFVFGLLFIAIALGIWWFVTNNHPNDSSATYIHENRTITKNTLTKNPSVEQKVLPPIVTNETERKNVNEWMGRLKQWINEFPFSQKETNSISNPPEVTDALKKFSDQIINEIINNSSLSRVEKTSILWDVYSNTTWPGNDNAIKAILMARLSELSPYELSENIFLNYQEMLAQGDQTMKSRHDLLQITDNILGLDTSILSEGEHKKYDEQVPHLKELLRQQIASIPNSSNELNDLLGYSMRIYANQANEYDIETLLPIIQSSIINNPEYSGEYYHSAFNNLLNNPYLTQSSLYSILTDPQSIGVQKERNKALSFLLKEDGNIALSNISEPIRQELMRYLESQKDSVKGSEFENDWQIATSRIQAMEINK